MSERATLPLEGSLDVSAASDLLERLSGTLAGDDASAHIELHLAGITRIDTACLQVLVAFARDAEALGTQVSWHEIPDVVTEASRALGVQSFLTSED